MDTVDFRGALLRGWRLLIGLAVVGAIVGFVLPSGGPSSSASSAVWSATTVVAPASGKDHISPARLFLDIKNPAVLSLAAHSVGETETAVATQITIGNGKTALGLSKRSREFSFKPIAISALSVSDQGAVNLANAVANAVTFYIAAQAKITYANAMTVNRALVANIQSQLGDVESQIANGGTSPQLSVLSAKKRNLESALGAEEGTQVALSLNGPTIPGFQVILPAVAAVPFSLKHSAVSAVAGHKSTRIIGGALLGLLIAAAIVILVEVLDRTLRSVRATEASFDLPVVAEVPVRSGIGKTLNGRPRAPRLDVVLEPTSIVAEAYRLLQTAVMLEPLAADIAGHGNPLANGNHNGNHNGVHHSLENGVHNGNGDGYPQGPIPVASPSNGVAQGRAKRQVILVVSPGLEPSRSPLVANLAAVFGESGAQALVVSIGNLAWRRARVVPGPALPSDGSIGPADIAPRAMQSQVQGVSGLRFDQLLQSRSQVGAMGPAIIEAAREIADVVIIEGPPLLAAHDAIALLPAVDVVLLVAEYAFTKSDQAKEAGDLLRRFRAPVLGVAFTNVPRKGEAFIRIGVEELDDHASVALSGPPSAAGLRT